MKIKRKAAAKPVGKVKTEQPPVAAVHRKSITIAILTGCAVLALPMGYLVSYYGFSRHSSISAMPAAETMQGATADGTVPFASAADNRIDPSTAQTGSDQPEYAVSAPDSIPAAEGKRPAPNAGDVKSALEEGVKFRHAGAYDKAIDAWKKALELDPRNATAANNIGIAWMYKNQPDIAIGWFEKALILDPSLAMTKHSLEVARARQASAAK